MKFFWQHSITYVSVLMLLMTPAQAKERATNAGQNVTYRPNNVKFVPPPPPPDLDIPGDRIGAGRRGCQYANSTSQAMQKQLTALVPATQQATGKQVVWGLTAAQQPTFLFYVPYRAQDAKSAKFVLRDAENKLIYQTAVNLPQTDSVVNLRLPAAVPLTIGKQYHWYFNVYCAARKPPISVVHGWVQRTTLKPDVERQLATATPQNRAAIYLANGIWYDAISTLAQLRSREPQNAAIAQDWASILRFVGSDAIATEPILQQIGDTSQNSQSSS